MEMYKCSYVCYKYSTNSSVLMDLTSEFYTICVSSIVRHRENVEKDIIFMCYDCVRVCFAEMLYLYAIQIKYVLTVIWKKYIQFIFLFSFFFIVFVVANYIWYPPTNLPTVDLFFFLFRLFFSFSITFLFNFVFVVLGFVSYFFFSCFFSF